MISLMVGGAIPAQFGSVYVQPLIRRCRERNNELNPGSAEAIPGCPRVVAHVHKLFLPILNQGRQGAPGDEASDEPVSIRGELTRSRGTIICTPSPSHSSREFNSGCVSFDRTPRGTVGSRLRPWVENGSEVWEEDGGLVVHERVSIIVGMVCTGVKGERVTPKVPKPVLGGEIIMGSLGVRGRGMSCGGEVRRDCREATGGGAARAGEEASSFCCIAIWTTRAADRGGRAGARGVRTGVTVAGRRGLVRTGVTVRLRRAFADRRDRVAERRGRFADLLRRVVRALAARGDRATTASGAGACGARRSSDCDERCCGVRRQ
nr:hypothetical protein Iba_chr13dCG4110 [Ipomoea batatas]